MGTGSRGQSQSAAGESRLLIRLGRHWRFIVPAANRTKHQSEIVFLEALELVRIIFQYPDPACHFFLTMVIAEAHARFTKSSAGRPRLRKGNADVTLSN